MNRLLASLAVFGLFALTGCSSKSVESTERHLGSWTPIAAVNYEGGGPPNPGKETPLIRKVVYELYPGGVRLRNNQEGTKNIGVDLAPYQKDGVVIYFDDAYDMSTGMVRFRDDNEMAVFKDGFETVYRRLPAQNSIDRLWVSPSVENPESLLVLGEQGDYAMISKDKKESGSYKLSETSLTFQVEGTDQTTEIPKPSDSLTFEGMSFVPLRDPAADFGKKIFANK